ncbi:TonB-dependent receptor [Echinicola sediminis]
MITCKGYTQTLTGIITDQNNSPVEGALVQSTQGLFYTSTNEQGQFFLSKKENIDSLKISHFNYIDTLIVLSSLKINPIIKLEEKLLSISGVTVFPDFEIDQVIADIDLKTNPVNSSQEILKKVPGLILGQHAGGGKAEQIFLRGFDIDHGTDISLSFDGMPVNMVSHAHGQGYADLHFIIPETLQHIEFGKGPYYSDQGNFSTAGHVKFLSKERLDKNQIKVEYGQFASRRLLGMWNIKDTADENIYVATELIQTDGPFESPQNLNRINLLLKYSGKISDKDRLSLSFSHFNSQWDASGQIPQRLVKEQKISRFGAVDDTEGGITGRSNLILNHHKKLTHHSTVKNTVFYSKYAFELYSNFTFFLQDPINGDQIRQSEEREMFGLMSQFNNQFHLFNANALWNNGIGFRNDRSINNELTHTVNRKTNLDSLSLGNILETNAYGFTNLEFEWSKFSFKTGLRMDFFNFNYYDQLLSTYLPKTKETWILSPNVKVKYSPNEVLQLYLKSGKGFHSNDTRVSVVATNKEPLPSAWGTDLGLTWKPMDKLLINSALWYLHLDQEFVYVGDEGIVEPSGKTRRQGIEFGIRAQPTSWLFWNFDTNYTYARYIDEKSGSNFIPLAPDFTLVSRINMIHPNNFYGGMGLIHIKDRPANETNTITAKGYTVFDLNIGYKWKKLDFGVKIQNLFNTDWNETQFATRSRLQNETLPVEEIHFTPGSPFFAIGSVTYSY